MDSMAPANSQPRPIIELKSAADAATLPIINTDELRHRCMHNAAFAVAMLDEMESGGRQHRAKILADLENRRLNDLAAVAHTLKGSAGIVGAERLRRSAQAVELARRTGEQPDMVLLLAEQLLMEIDVLIDELPHIKRQLTGDNSRA